MKPTGTKFKKFNKKWEIYYADEKIKEYKCICKDRSVHEFRDFTEDQLEGVEFI